MQKDIQQQILDSCLVPLMDNYEGPQRNVWITIEGSHVEEFEAVREFKAHQVAQGWLKRSPGDGYRLTDKGYLQHLPRAMALRAMGQNREIKVTA